MVLTVPKTTKIRVPRRRGFIVPLDSFRYTRNGETEKRDDPIMGIEYIPSILVGVSESTQ